MTSQLPVFKTHLKLSLPVVTLESDKTPQYHIRNSPAPTPLFLVSPALTLSCSNLGPGMHWMKAKVDYPTDVRTSRVRPDPEMKSTPV